MPYKAGHHKAPIYTAARLLDRVHVLVIDSSPVVTALFKDMLSTLGFTNVFIAHDVVHAMQILKEAEINLLITDWELQVPQQDIRRTGESVCITGIDFVSRLRRTPSVHNRFIPVLMLVDAVERMHIISARDAGVNEIATKPLTAHDLCKRIRLIIDKPRPFITAKSYQGPCRRRHEGTPAPSERRKHDIRLVKRDEAMKG